MSLDLDKRQRAMLREMGVRVWQPMAPMAPMATLASPVAVPAAPELLAVVAPVVSVASAVAIDSIASRAQPTAATGTFDQKIEELPPAAAADSSAAAWRMGEAFALYVDAQATKGPRWLVLAETPASALQADSFNPFEGEAGKLLDNMLRAARLDKVGAVTLAPLVRGAASDTGLMSSLSALITSAQPDVVLVMGRMAAQALLQSNEPFGKLRGQVHDLHGVATVVTHDAPYLLRTPLDKAKAWDDLCLAIHVAIRKAA